MPSNHQPVPPSFLSFLLFLGEEWAEGQFLASIGFKKIGFLSYLLCLCVIQDILPSHACVFAKCHNPLSSQTQRLAFSHRVRSS